MRREWEPEELIDCWTLVDDDWELVAKKRGATRLGFALLFKFYELEGRFPRHAGEVPKPALGYIAAQVKVAAAAFSDYEWTGGRSTTTGRRSARRWVFARPPLVTRTSSPAGWPRRSARWSCPRTGCGRR